MATHGHPRQCRGEAGTVLLQITRLPELHEQNDTGQRDQGGEHVGELIIDEVGHGKLGQGKGEACH